MKQRTWKILDRGEVRPDADMVSYGGPCGHEALLPINGTPVAEAAGGLLVFDPGEQAMPTKIRCRTCGVTYITSSEE